MSPVTLIGNTRFAHEQETPAPKQLHKK